MHFNSFFLVVSLCICHAFKKYGAYNSKNHVQEKILLKHQLQSTNLEEDDGFEVNFDDNFLKSLTKKRPYISILIERFMQGLDDSQVSKRAKSAANDESYNSENSIPKQKFVVLGSGWGAYSFLKTIDPTKYEVVVVSPRNYFTFTPMLAASAVGTVEFRSICEPIRNISPLIKYIEASALSINPKTKQIECQSLKCSGTVCEDYVFNVSYDQLLIAVGSMVNTFGIKGVRDNCQFLKQIEDAANIRKALAYCFERASIPDISDEERRTALSFVIVGAGPTGVELIGELRDWMEAEGRRYYPHLLKFAQIVLVEAGNAVLAVFDKQLQQEALDRLTKRETKLLRDGLLMEEITRVRLGVGVMEVGEKSITLSTGEQLPYGFCVWAAGVGPTPLVTDLVNSVEDQRECLAKTRGRIATDGWLRVRGCEGVYSIGDCNFVEDYPLPVEAHLSFIINVTATAQVASQQGAYLGRLLSKGFKMGSYSSGANNKLVPPFKILRINETSSPAVPVATSELATSVQIDFTTSASLVDGSGADVGQETVFPSERLGIGSLGVTQQVPAVNVDGKEVVDTTSVTIEYAKPFQFLNLGVLAYVGASQALAQVSVDDKNLLGSGPLGFLLWRGVYWFKQVSWRNRVLIVIDWIKARLFGRDIGSLSL